MHDDLRPYRKVGLYFQVERIFDELRARGIGEDESLRVEDLSAHDNYHYRGTDTVDEAVGLLGIGPDSRVLDIGSGIGGAARYMAHATGCRVTALELQPRLHDTGARLTERCGLAGRVRHLCGDLMAGKPAEQRFDAITGWLVIAHIPDRPALFRRLRELLAPGGRLFVEDFYARGRLTPRERRALREQVHMPYLPDLTAFEAAPREAGLAAIRASDQTASWAEFIVERKRRFRAMRERNVAVHGATVYEALDGFYALMDGLFRGGNLGGARLTARGP